MREYRLGILIALAVMAWSARADAAYSLANMTAPPTQVGTTSAATTATLSTDQGGNPKVDLFIDMNDCTGTGSGTFTLTPNNNIALMNPQTISLTYSATTAGSLTCMAYIYDHATTTAGGTFTVTGSGQRPPTITGAFTTTGPFTAVRFNDGAIAPHTSLKSINITNTGERQLNISSVSINNNGENNFAITSGNLSDTIAAGGTKGWQVTFNPMSAGDKTATITFASNDPNTPNFTMNLLGTGTTGVLAVTQPTAFPVVVAGSAATAAILMSNIGILTKGTLSVTRAQITNPTIINVTSPPNWFSVTACNNTDCNFGGVPIQFVTSNSTNLNIRCAPPTGTAANTTETATLTVTADNDPATTPMNTLLLTCTAGASDLAFAAGINSLDFGSILVNTDAQTQTVTITNAGNSSANNVFVAPAASSVGTAPLFPVSAAKGGTACTSSSMCTLAPGDSMVVTVGFHPLVEGYATASFEIRNQGQPPSFTVSGKGIDKKIATPEAVDFPDTFRNPGSKAIPVAVPVVNTGEYPLTITELDLNGQGVFELVDPAGFEIPSLGTHDVMIRFVPAEAGKAPEGALAVLNNSSNNVMPVVRLLGNGKARNVDMSPGSVDVGETFAGVPVLLSVSRPEEVLKVANMETGDDGDFTIRQIKITGTDAAMFEVQALGGGDLDGRSLPRGAEVMVDVVFKPTYVGNFTASLELYLDEDTVPQTPVPIHGTALFVDAHGSGGFGCSTGRSSRGAMLLVMGAVLLVLRRRRR